MRKGIMAMESMDGEDVNDEGGDVTEFVDSAESDIIEMDNAANQVESVDQGIDEAADTADTMDAMRGSLEEAAEEGGISEPAAEAVRVAVEHLCARIGLASSKHIFPSMEDFGDKSSRVRATKYAVENLKETAKSIWDAIVKVFNRAIDWIKNFYRSLTDGSIRLAKRAEAIKKKAKELGNAQIKADAKVSAGGFSKQLNIGGVVPSSKEFASKFKEYSKNSQTLNTAVAKLATDGKNAVSKLMAVVGDDSKGPQAVDAVVGVFKDLEVGKDSSNKDHQADGCKVTETDLFFADKAFYSRVPNVGVIDDGFDKAIGGMKFFIAQKTGAKEATETTQDVAPLSKDDITTVATAVKLRMDSYKDFAKEIKEIEAARDSIRKGMDKLKTVTNENDRISQRIAKAYVSAVTSGAAAIRGNDIKVCKAALDYCGASLKQAAAPAKEGEKK